MTLASLPLTSLLTAHIPLKQIHSRAPIAHNQASKIELLLPPPPPLPVTGGKRWLSPPLEGLDIEGGVSDCIPGSGAGLEAGAIALPPCTFTGSLIPPKQYNGAPLMKYFSPGEVRVIEVFPLLAVSIALLALQLLYPALSTSLTF